MINVLTCRSRPVAHHRSQSLSEIFRIDWWLKEYYTFLWYVILSLDALLGKQKHPMRKLVFCFIAGPLIDVIYSCFFLSFTGVSLYSRRVLWQCHRGSIPLIPKAIIASKPKCFALARSLWTIADRTKREHFSYSPLYGEYVLLNSTTVRIHL